jgi:hypothetical protein
MSSILHCPLIMSCIRWYNKAWCFPIIFWKWLSKTFCLLFDPQDRDKMFLQNFDEPLLNYTALQPRWLYSSTNQKFTWNIRTVLRTDKQLTYLRCEKIKRMKTD